MPEPETRLTRKSRTILDYQSLGNGIRLHIVNLGNPQQRHWHHRRYLLFLNSDPATARPPRHLVFRHASNLASRERDPPISLSNLEIGSTPNCVPTNGKSISLADCILQTSCDHLIAVNPRLKPLIEKHACPIFSPDSLSTAVDSFESLCISIISQQVSGAAAAAIKSRFLALFDVIHSGERDPPSPAPAMCLGYQ